LNSATLGREAANADDYAMARQRTGWLLFALSVLISLVGNSSDVLLLAAGVVAGPFAFTLALYPALGARNGARIAGVLAAMLALATFAISLAVVYGLSHGGESAPYVNNQT
jgi:hypothetical protein